MASKDRRRTHRLGLAETPWAYELFAAARALDASTPSAPGFGRSRVPSEDPARFAQTPSLVFAPRDVDAFDGDGARARLSVFFPGLFGPHGPMPLHLTEWAVERTRHEEDDSFAAFADIFHHRFLSLLYRAWADGRPELELAERPQRFSGFLTALSGLANDPAERGFDVDARARFVGHLSAGRASAERIERTLSAVFGFKVKVREFIGEWLAAPLEERARLGGLRPLQSRPVLGARVWSRAAKIEIVIGPLRRRDFNRFNGPGRETCALANALAGFVGPETAWRLRLLLDRRDAAGARLDGSFRLGRDAWAAPARRGGPLDDHTLSDTRIQMGSTEV